jgi:membrane protease YdiL (CAAX protease family)
MKECKLIGSCYGTAVGYFISLLAIVLWMRNDFITDFEMLREKKKFYLIYIPIAAVSFAILAILLDMLFSNFAGDSSNQSSIEAMLHSKGAVPMIMSTVLFAPIVEEMIYRKAIFSLAKDTSLPLAYTMSIVLFALPHMLSTASSVGMWFLQLIPYLLCGALLCVVYHLSKYNVYASIAAHMLNNLIAVISVFIRR